MVYLIRGYDGLAFMARGATFRKIGEVDNAIKDFSEAIRLNPQWPEPYHHRGYMLFVKQDYAMAVKDFSQFIELEPHVMAGYQWRCLAYRAMGKEKEAKADEQKVKEMRKQKPLGSW
jgi:tetratricopeptide (TPR) repeat protein